MSQFIREIEPGVELFRDAVTGIAWAEDHRTGLGVSVHPNIDESGSVEGLVTRGWWRSSDRVARSHGGIYNIDRLSYNKDDPVEVAVAAECKCTACMERRTEKDTRYQALLFYGWQEGDEGVYHAFKMEDPAGEADDEEIAKELADMLDTEPTADDFNFTDMYVSLPQSLVDRIKADGVKEYLEQGQ